MDLRIFSQIILLGVKLIGIKVFTNYTYITTPLVRNVLVKKSQISRLGDARSIIQKVLKT